MSKIKEPLQPLKRFQTLVEERSPGQLCSVKYFVFLFVFIEANVKKYTYEMQSF